MDTLDTTATTVEATDDTSVDTAVTTDTAAVEVSDAADKTPALEPTVDRSKGEVPSVPQGLYTPSFKYKVKDSELEFEDWLKPLVKDKATEDKMRDILTRSHGIEEVKKSRDDFKTRLEEVEPKYKNIDASLSYLSDLVNKQDIRGFIEATNLPKDAILKYAIEELKYLQMPPEQRQQIDSSRAEQYRVQELEDRNSLLQQQLYQNSVSGREQELAMVTSRPDVTSVVNQYNALVGKPDAFRAKVVEKGLTHFHLTGQDLSASQAVEAVLAEVGPFLKALPQTQGAAGNASFPQAQSGQTVVVTNKPTIPNISSGGVSAVKKQPRSLDDLKRLRQQMNAG